MADPNIEGPLAPPVRSDNDILPFSKWVAIWKSNCYVKTDKPQNHPIFRMALDLLKNTTFFNAFTASSTIPSIYIQQFRNTIFHDRVTNTYKCQLDEHWVNITMETLGSALQILRTGDNVEYTPP